MTAADPLQTAAPHRDSWATGSVSGCTVAQFRFRSETGARLSLLILAVTTAGIALVALLLDLIVNVPYRSSRSSSMSPGSAFALAELR